jgi:Asp-tRNA(Asn)/Glu-tRNA(Gln) amidotransferase A subunit family amidase
LLCKFNKDYPWSINYNKNIKKFKKNSFFKIGVFNQNFYLYKDFDKKIIDYLSDILNKDHSFKLIKVKQLDILSTIHYHHDILYKKSLYYYSKKSGLIFKKMGKKLINYIFQGKKISANKYLESVKYKEFANKIFDRHFKKNYDFIIVPTTVSIAPKHEQKEKNDTCLIWSFLGYPCISLPVYNKKIKELPFGILIVAPKYYDLNLIKFSRIIENKINVR